MDVLPDLPAKETTIKVQAAVTTAEGSGFHLRTLELDEPRSDEVRVAIKAAGICHTDLLFADMRKQDGAPAVFGHEGAGVVEAVGASVAGVRPGDRVLISFDSCGACTRCVRGEPYYCDRFAALNFAGHQSDRSTSLRLDRQAAGPLLRTVLACQPCQRSRMDARPPRG